MPLLALVPALRLAVDPVRSPLDHLLDDDTLVQAVQAELARQRPRPLMEGRPSTPVEVLLRLLGGQPVYGWSEEATERWGSARLVWRQCCRGYAASGPEDTTLLRWANLLQPETLPRLLAQGVLLARALKVTPGRPLRIDGTVVAPHIHPPTDRTLLYESVRVLSRTLGKAKQGLQATRAVARQVFRERTRRAKRQRKRRMDAARHRGTAAAARRHPASHPLLARTRVTVQQAPRVAGSLQGQAPQACQQLRAPLAHVSPLSQQVLGQTTRRVLQGEAVPAPEKVGSRLEPPTALLRTGKPGWPTDFGRVIWWDEVAGGIISRYAVRAGNPAEDAQLPPSLAQPLRVCQRPPRLLAGDRGVPSPANEQDATMHGVKKVVLPKPGAKAAKRIAYDQPRGGRRGHNWRAGSDGRSSRLKRRHPLERCRYPGTAGMARWVGWGVITPHLRGIAQATAASPARQAPKAGATSRYGQTLERHKSSKGFCTTI